MGARSARAARRPSIGAGSRGAVLVLLVLLVALTACGSQTGGTATAASASSSAPAPPTGSASPSASALPPLPQPSLPEGTVSVEVSNWPPGLILAGDDAMWVLVSEVTSIDIFRIDPETMEATLVLADLPPEQIVATGVAGSLWVVSWDASTVTEYDVETGRRLGTLPVGDAPIEPIFAFGDLWTLNHNGGSVTRIDTATSTVEATVDVGATGLDGPMTYAVAGDLLWVAGPNTPELVAIDPETNAVVETLELPTSCQPEITDVDGLIWLWGCQYEGGDVIDPTTLEAVGTREELDTYLTRPLTLGGRNWVAVLDPMTTGISALAAVDLETFAVVDQVPIDPHGGVAVAAFDSMWVTVGRAVHRIPASALDR